MEKRPPCWPLDEYLNKKIRVNMKGDIYVEGVLSGFDQVGNLVLNDSVFQKPSTPAPDTEPRKLGTAVIRAPQIISIDYQ